MEYQNTIISYNRAKECGYLDIPIINKVVAGGIDGGVITCRKIKIPIFTLTCLFFLPLYYVEMSSRSDSTGNTSNNFGVVVFIVSVIFLVMVIRFFLIYYDYLNAMSPTIYDLVINK